jgi:LPXTG-motif cell wall-anchored protein
MIKRSVLAISMTLLLIFSILNVAAGQDQPKPKKDTVNMDTNAKPTYYYPVEDDKKGKSPVVTIAIVAGAVVVVGAAGFFFLRRKK